MKLYPGGSIKSPEWQAIRAYIRARAGDQCEECGVGNYEVGFRRQDTGEWVRITDMPNIWKGTKTEAGEKIFMIVCTVAHFDQKLVDHSSENLRFWCQRCHNRHDAKDRAKNGARTRRLKTHGPDLVEWIEGHL